MAGKTPFVIYQGAWSILQRDLERDILPMARAEGWVCNSFIYDLRTRAHPDHPGLALAPWGVLAGGRIRTDEEEERRRQTGENGRSPLIGREKYLVDCMRDIAKVVLAGYQIGSARRMSAKSARRSKR